MKKARRCLLAIALPSAFAASPPATLAQEPPPADSAGAPRLKRPLAAAFEGLGVNVGLNRFNDWIWNVHNSYEGYWARVGFRSWSTNIRYGWTWDTDAFNTNMFAHPVHGGAYFRAGRQNGLTFWESVPLPFLGSAEWEYFGETARPSLNDFYNTSFGGIVLGEMTYRLVALVRDNEAGGTGRILREIAALPLDPVGTVKRLLVGDFSRLHPNPPVRTRGALSFELQGGPRLAVDSGTAGRRVVAPSLVAELFYGDPFARPYARPFDVFRARLQLGLGGHSVNDLVVSGRLFAHEFTTRSTTIRTFFTVNQKLVYTESPAYKFGGQMLDVGLVAGFALGPGIAVRTESYAEGIMLGAVDAPGAGVAGTPRTYDFGPGVGFDVGASLLVQAFPVLSLRWHGAVVHSVSGSPADHFTQLPSVEAGLPLTGALGLGVYAGWYQRRSAYAEFPGEVTTYPDFRAYLVWHRHRAAGRAAPR